MRLHGHAILEPFVRDFGIRLCQTWPIEYGTFHDGQVAQWLREKQTSRTNNAHSVLDLSHGVLGFASILVHVGAVSERLLKDRRISVREETAIFVPRYCRLWFSFRITIQSDWDVGLYIKKY